MTTLRMAGRVDMCASGYRMRRSIPSPWGCVKSRWVRRRQDGDPVDGLEDSIWRLLLIPNSWRRNL